LTSVRPERVSFITLRSQFLKVVLSLDDNPTMFAAMTYETRFRPRASVSPPFSVLMAAMILERACAMRLALFVRTPTRAFASVMMSESSFWSERSMLPVLDCAAALSVIQASPLVGNFINSAGVVQRLEGRVGAVVTVTVT
jgi:hypothetical protein